MDTLNNQRPILMGKYVNITAVIGAAASSFYSKEGVSFQEIAMKIRRWCVRLYKCVFVSRWTNDPALSVYFICLPVCDGHNLLFEFSDGVMMSHAAGGTSQSICLQAHEPESVSRCSLGGTLLSFLLLTPQDIADSAYIVCFEGWAISQLATFLHVA